MIVISMGVTVVARFPDALGIGKKDNGKVFHYLPCFIHLLLTNIWSFPGGAVVKNPPANAKGARDRGSIPGLGRSPGLTSSKLLQCSWPGKVHGQRNLEGYSSWGQKEVDMTEQLSRHTHITNIY